jgi:hypothetical protein
MGYLLSLFRQNRYVVRILRYLLLIILEDDADKYSGEAYLCSFSFFHFISYRNFIQQVP